ncbi:sulfotransferase family protein [Parvularcula sp. IMCC14364]|uniref:sulfotransferase family protein n=1 Tax=Parvularcula sp. IMCC14364 TaxID=3067902 RepID=UPI00274251E1|nr:sulfotransferase family protein [Parvularcula sp. IMCC14364]
MQVEQAQIISYRDFHRSVNKRIKWHEFNLNCMISLKHRYLYVETPKVACSTIKLALMKLETEGLNYDAKVPHPTLFESPVVKPYHLSDELLHEVFFSDKFFRFSFVRNPYTRVLSAYLDKIDRKKNPVKQVRRALGHDAEADVDITFEQFLDAINLTKQRDQDKHWRPQSELLLNGYLDFHYLGRFENFEEDWRNVAERINPTMLEDMRDIPWHATNADDQLKEFYTPELTEKFMHNYASDFELYNYGKAISG